jgi:PPOX class probable F420-dependent enzyme
MVPTAHGRCNQSTLLAESDLFYREYHQVISSNPAWEEFIRAERWAVLTTLRTSGAPVSSMVAYACDGDELVISTPGMTFKRASIERNPQVSLCIINRSEPFNFVSIEGKATVTSDHLVEKTRLVFDKIADIGFPEPDDLEGWLDAQQRVILSIKASRTYGVIR